jgi:predicted dehydrogenase
VSLTERLRWGILGAAHIAQTQFVPGVRASQSGTVAAVASRDWQRARAMADAHAIPRAYGSYTDLLADPQVDAIYVALPNSLHAEWTIEAARARKHVLCEKPLTRRAADALRAAAACREAGVVLMEAFMWRHHPQHARVEALLRAGTIGEPNLVRAAFSYVIAPGANVRLARDLDGGSLMDVGCYAVDAARWVFRDEPFACVAQQIVEPAVGVDVSFAGVLRFPGDRLALVDSSFRQTFTHRYEIVGAAGRIVVPRAFRPDALPGRIEITTSAGEHIEESPPLNQYAAQVDHFASSVRAGRLLPPAEDGVAQAHAIEALYAGASR